METKNGTFSKITLNIALDMDCFISLIGQLLKKIIVKEGIYICIKIDITDTIYIYIYIYQ